MCVCDLYKCILIAIDELCKVLRAPERWGAIQMLIILIIIIKSDLCTGVNLKATLNNIASLTCSKPGSLYKNSKSIPSLVLWPFVEAHPFLYFCSFLTSLFRKHVFIMYNKHPSFIHNFIILPQVNLDITRMCANEQYTRIKPK